VAEVPAFKSAGPETITLVCAAVWEWQPSFLVLALLPTLLCREGVVGNVKVVASKYKRHNGMDRIEETQHMSFIQGPFNPRD
jgi:hypothetical protein